MSDSEWPKDVEGFLGFLEAKGLVCSKRSTANRVPHRDIECSGLGIRVRIVVEMGFWTVELADEDRVAVWYDVALLSLLLEERGEDRMSFSSQLRFAQSHWPEILRVFSPPQRDETHTRLHAIRRERATRLFGLRF